MLERFRRARLALNRGRQPIVDTELTWSGVSEWLGGAYIGLSFLIGLATALYVWWLAIQSSVGWVVGFSLGWIPGLVAGLLVGFLWPLGVLLVAAVLLKGI